MTRPTKKKTPIAPRKAPRQERAQATVEAILEATAAVLREEGYDGLTTNKVAEAAGVSVGSLYQYYPGKDALVTAVLLRFAEAQHAGFLSAIASVAAAPVPVVIEKVIETLMAQSDADPLLATVLMNQIPRVGELGEVIAYNEEKTARPLRAFLEARKADLAIDDLNAAVFLLTHSITPLLQRMRISRATADERRAIFRELKAMLVAYLAGPGGQSRTRESPPPT
ncbi:TetR/AcrR family transcriptional regulator [soil metagenome]